MLLAAHQTIPHAGPGPAPASIDGPSVRRRLHPLTGTRYRSIRRIGEGGMGVVYEAEHIDLGQRVAIKVLAAHLTEDPAAVASFREEARTASRLGAEQIVRVSDFAELRAGGLMYAMELLDGPMLRDVLDERTHLEPARAIAILRQLCKGLAAAHAANVVHRDIKPDNIGLVRSASGREDAVKILDFGLSTIDDLERVGRATVAGTASYLAPELIEGRHYDHRVDQYALGCTAYEMLAGRPPFDGDEQTSPEDVLRRHLTTQPLPLRRAGLAGVPRALERVILRCLAKNPAERFGDMHEVEAALCEAQVSAGIVTPWDDLPTPAGASRAVRRRLGPRARSAVRRRTAGLAVAAALTLTVGVAGGLAWMDLGAATGVGPRENAAATTGGADDAPTDEPAAPSPAVAANASEPAPREPAAVAEPTASLDRGQGTAQPVAPATSTAPEGATDSSASSSDDPRPTAAPVPKTRRASSKRRRTRRAATPREASPVEAPPSRPAAEDAEPKVAPSPFLEPRSRARGADFL